MRISFSPVLIIVFGLAGFGFLAGPFLAQAADLEVNFTPDPLFSEGNFLPGDTITGSAAVINNSSETQRVITEAINKTDPDGLGGKLNLEIKEGATSIFNDTLAAFFAAGEVFLSDLAGNSSTTYDFIVSFLSSSDNVYQGKVLGFDLLLGFEGSEESGGGGGTGGGGGGGGGSYAGSPSGLLIPDESVVAVGTSTTTAVITWDTSFFSTSRVIYAGPGEAHSLDLSDTADDPPKYGYERTTAEFDTPADVNGVKDHSVTLSGLLPGETYFYRVISHASPDTISKEYSFTTAVSGVSEEGGAPEAGQEETAPLSGLPGAGSAGAGVVSPAEIAIGPQAPAPEGAGQGAEILPETGELQPEAGAEPEAGEALPALEQEGPLAAAFPAALLQASVFGIVPGYVELISALLILLVIWLALRRRPRGK